MLDYSINGERIQKVIDQDLEFNLITGETSPLEYAKKRESGLTNLWTCFRKTVSLDKKPSKALARIAVDSKYWLWINGKMVIFEGQLKRGPAPNDTYYDTVDLEPYLQKGENTIAVLVWYFGKEAFSHNSSGQSGLVFDAKIDGIPLLSNHSWKARSHPSYGCTYGTRVSYRMLAESNLYFDARLDLLGWQKPGYDDSKWPAAKEFGTPPCAPWNNLVLRPIPQWKDFGLKDYMNQAELPKISNGKMIRAKLPYNAQVTPYLKIEGPEGKLIDIRTDNYRGGYATNVRGEYVTRSGIQEYENLGWMNGHEIFYSIPKGFKIHALKYRETGYDTEFTGTFECDDEFMNRYREKALRTLYITMRDTYMDCPDRERAQYWGDVVNEMGEAFYALDPKANLLARKGILEVANWQRDDDTLYAPVPSGSWHKELPMQMLNTVGYFGFWTYYMYTGDLDTIRTVYPSIKRYMSVWKLGKDGLVIKRRGGWPWGDWGQNKDMTILYNCWFYLALKGQKLMAEAIGANADISEIKMRMKSIEDNFNKTFWNGKAYRSPDYKGLIDERGHALAVLAGLAKPEQYKAIREVFKMYEHSSPYMEKYVGEALYQMRLVEDAFVRTKKRFKVMVDHPYTTLWEAWVIRQKGAGTINHAWSGGMLTLLSQYGAGVAPVTPGYGSYHVLPQMGPLKYIKTVVPTVKGEIKLQLDNQTDYFSIRLDSPAHTEAVVGIPKSRGKKIRKIEVKGQTAWQRGKIQNEISGLHYLEETEHYIKFILMPGSWDLKARFH